MRYSTVLINQYRTQLHGRAQPRVSECTEAAQTAQDVLHTALNIQYAQRSKARRMYMKLHVANAGYQLGASLASPAG